MPASGICGQAARFRGLRCSRWPILAAKCACCRMQGHCRILKLGKNLMVFDIDIVANGETVAHATYSIPQKR